MENQRKDEISSDSRAPELRLRHRNLNQLTNGQKRRRNKVLERIEVVGEGKWLWTGQAKSARGNKYPQIVHTLGRGVTQLVNARHVVFYLATGWVHKEVQQYRARDGNPLNVHPDNLVPVPPLQTPRGNNNFWDTERLRQYYG